MKSLRLNRKIRWSPTVSNYLLLATIALLSFAAAMHITWLLTGNWAWVKFFFDYPSPIFYVAISGAELWLSIIACRLFSPGQSLRSAWFMISCSAGFHFVGALLTQWLTTDSYLNPLFVFGVRSYESLKPILLHAGRIIGGPLEMIMLACGLMMVLLLYRKMGLLGKLRPFDWLLVAIVAVYTLRVIYVVFRLQLSSGGLPSIPALFDWMGDPLLCVLLFESVWVRRSVVDMGWGLVSKCWGAFVAAIFLTSLGSMANWAANFSYLPWPQLAVSWYIWYLPAVAFALAPAYQVQSALTARARLAPLLEAKEVLVESA